MTYLVQSFAKSLMSSPPSSKRTTSTVLLRGFVPCVRLPKTAQKEQLYRTFDKKIRPRETREVVTDWQHVSFSSGRRNRRFSTNVVEQTTKYLIGPCRSCPADRFAKSFCGQASLAHRQGYLNNYPELFVCGTEQFLVHIPVGRVKRADIHKQNGRNLSRPNCCKHKISRVKRAAESGKIVQFSY